MIKNPRRINPKGIGLIYIHIYIRVYKACVRFGFRILGLLAGVVGRGVVSFEGPTSGPGFGLSFKGFRHGH